jgi:hypothetical protein
MSRRGRILTTIALAAMLSACERSKTPTTPTTPLPGVVRDTSATTTPTTRTTAITAVGEVSGLSGRCPSISFTLGRDTSVVTDATTTFRVACTAVANGMRVGVVGARQANGTFLAKEVVAATTTPTPTPTPRPTPTPLPPVPAPGASVSLSGQIGDLASSCPRLTFTVARVKTHTNSSTVFDGKTCVDLKNRDAVQVIGTRAADATVLATKVTTRR